MASESVFHYYQSDDPGAVGAGKYWLFETLSGLGVRRRNEADTDWDDITSADNPMTAKGDLLTRSAVNLVRQPVGSTDGEVLTADSTTSTGLNWRLPTGAAGGVSRAAIQQWLTGKYYNIFNTFPASEASLTAFGLTTGRMVMSPLFVPNDKTVDRIGAHVALQDVGKFIRLGIYNHGSSTNLPTTLVIDGGAVSCGTTGVLAAVTISQALSAGWYWLAMISDGAPQIYGNKLYIGFQGWTNLSENPSSFQTPYETRAYGALPASFSLTAYVTGGIYGTGVRST